MFNEDSPTDRYSVAVQVQAALRSRGYKWECTSKFGKVGVIVKDNPRETCFVPVTYWDDVKDIADRLELAYLQQLIAGGSDV